MAVAVIENSFFVTKAIGSLQQRKRFLILCIYEIFKISKPRTIFGSFGRMQ